MERLQYLYLDALSEFRASTIRLVAQEFGAIELEGPLPALPHDYVWLAHAHFRIDEGRVSLWFPSPIDSDFEQKQIALYYRDVDEKKLANFLDLFCTALVSAQRGENDFRTLVPERRPWLWVAVSAAAALLAFFARRYAHI